MNKTKYLVGNIALLTVGQFGTKLLSFFLVPLYTNILSTSEYGIYDLFHASVSILVPLLTINIYEAVLRFALDKDTNKDDIFSIGIRYTLIGTTIVAVLLFFNYFFKINIRLKDYSFYFFTMFLTQSLSGIITSFVRGIERIADYSISGVICSTVIILSNIIFLIVFKWGLNGYFLANILGSLVQIFYLLIRIRAWNYLKWRAIDGKLIKKMRGYSIPTIVNSVAWWINGLSDRYIITWLCGLSENGVYAVASKIPSILNIFQSIFSQAWMLSSVKEFDKDDKSGFFTFVYNMYNALLVIICSGIIVFDKFLSMFLYAKEFFAAWKYVPFLTMAIIFGAISGYVGGIFAALRKSEIFAKCSGTGAVVNIVLNMIFVRYIGVLGAAIATAFSYWTIYVISIYYLKNNMNIKLLLFRDNVSYLILLTQSFWIVLYNGNIFILYVILIALFVIQIVLYWNQIKSFVNQIITLAGDIKK